ncbi:MAG: DUF1801 domain-containing protein [Anaerolineae bacterium]|nr:DUF1801 domain-containing protein [Anaerolineae bacterium]
MAEMKTKKTEQSVEAFLNTVSDEQKRKDSFVILDMMQKAAGEAKMWGESIVGCGNMRLKYESTGKEVDWFPIGFSPRKQALTLYLRLGGDHSPELLTKLGKFTTGKGCLYIKKLADVDVEVLKQLIDSTLKYTESTKAD